MKIFFYGSDYPPTGGGISTHTKEWLNAICSRVEGKVHIFGNRKPRREKLGNLVVKTSRSANFFVIGSVVKWTMIFHRNYDIFHAFNLFPVGFFVVFWARVFGKKSILSFYGQDACDTRTSRKVIWLQRWAIRNAWKCVTISEFTKQKIMERYGISGENIHVIHPVLPQFEKENEEDIRATLGINSTDFVLVTVSRLVRRKGIEYQIEAISKIPDPSFKLIVVGEGPEEENLKNLAEKLNLKNRVYFAGKVPHLAPYYRAGNVAALTSYSIPEEGDFEGLGIVLLEAQSYGLPVIGTKSGGIPEAFQDGKTGITVPERDSGAIAAAILRLKNEKFEDPTNFLEREFGKENTIGKYLKLIS